jgi:signal transduction histidine kinase
MVDRSDGSQGGDEADSRRRSVAASDRPADDGLKRRVTDVLRLPDTLFPDFLRRRLLAKMLLGLLAVIVTSGAVGGFFYAGISDRLETETDREVRATISLHESAYETWLDNRHRELSTVVKEDLPGGSADTQISYALDLARSRSEAIRHYHYVNESSGKIIASSSDAAVGRSIHETGINETTLAQQSFVYPERYRSFDGYTAFAMGESHPYLDRVLVAEIPAEEAPPTLEHPVRGATTTVANRRGDVVLGTEPVETMPADLDSETTVAQTDSQILAYRPIAPGHELVVVTQTPKSTAFSVRTEVLRSFIVTLLLMLVIVTGVALLGGRPVMRDLSRLVRKAERMAEGNLDVDLRTRRRDEVGTLYREFDEMRAGLKSRLVEIEESRARLEEQNLVISVLNRVLRHNVRNDLHVVRAHAKLLASGEDNGDPEVIVEHVDDLMEEAEQARMIEKFAATDPPEETIDLRSSADAAARAVGEKHGELAVTVDASTEVIVRADESLITAIEAIVSHLRKCHEGDSFEVTIRVAADPSPRIRVATTSDGLPPVERDAFAEGRENQLQHAASVGLWLADRVLSAFGGTIDISNEGATFDLVFPDADADLNHDPDDDPVDAPSQSP